jgi:hypothetical protein
LREIKINGYFIALRAFENDVLMINKWNCNCNSSGCNVLLYNFRTGELLNEFRVTSPTWCLFETPDKEFLVMSGERKILFYHLKGAYVYSEFEPTQRLHFQNLGAEELRNRKFARLINSDRSLVVFDYEK